MSEVSTTSRVVGVVPWLPWPLSAWRWWTEPVRAERLAALRIGLALCLLLDIVLTYLPGVGTFFGAARSAIRRSTATCTRPRASNGRCCSASAIRCCRSWP